MTANRKSSREEARARYALEVLEENVTLLTTIINAVRALQANERIYAAALTAATEIITHETAERAATALARLAPDETPDTEDEPCVAGPTMERA